MPRITHGYSWRTALRFTEGRGGGWPGHHLNRFSANWQPQRGETYQFLAALARRLKESNPARAQEVQAMITGEKP